MNETELPQEAKEIQTNYQSPEEQITRLNSVIVAKNNYISKLLEENSRLKSEMFGHLKSIKPVNY
jgi:predicted  nucleic acid-binding Zn-ribbon protein